jgi:trehalose 6-phosphate phosphatase
VTDLLAEAQRKVLGALAARRTLLAFDFDGTLAPIVPLRDRARLGPRTVRMLGAVAARWPCVVISGRARDDVRRRLDGVPLLAVVGNHGAEQRPALPGVPAWRARTRRWRGRLQSSLAGVPGVDLEDKGLTLAVHVRRSSSRPDVVRALRDLRGSRVVAGKRVFNVVPSDAPDKGVALARLVRRGRFERVLFVGDDDTDEDVFRRNLGVPTVGVRVGQHAGSAAPYYLRRQADVDRLLERLRQEREAGPGSFP